MTRNSLYALIGLLAVLVVGFGLYIVYQESQKPSLEVRLDQNGLSIDGNGG